MSCVAPVVVDDDDDVALPVTTLTPTATAIPSTATAIQETAIFLIVFFDFRLLKLVLFLPSLSLLVELLLVGGVLW